MVWSVLFKLFFIIKLFFIKSLFLIHTHEFHHRCSSRGYLSGTKISGRQVCSINLTLNCSDINSANFAGTWIILAWHFPQTPLGLRSEQVLQCMWPELHWRMGGNKKRWQEEHRRKSFRSLALKLACKNAITWDLKILCTSQLPVDSTN